MPLNPPYENPYGPVTEHESAPGAFHVMIELLPVVTEVGEATNVMVVCAATETVTVRDSCPPSNLIQLSIYEVLLYSGGVICEPLVPPNEKLGPDAVPELPFCADHTMLALVATDTVLGFAVMLSTAPVGGGGGGG